MSSDDEVEVIKDLRPLRALLIKLRRKKLGIAEPTLKIPPWPDALEVEEVEQTEAASR